MKRLHFDAVTLHAGSRTLVDSLTQGIGAGEMWCIAGPNGAGKVTLDGPRLTHGARRNSRNCAC